MKKLSTLIRKENCFFTKDGQVLKNIQDLLDYLINADEEDYANHVNETKNDFASWVGEVLLFPDLQSSLKLTKSIVEARDTLMEFLQAFDYTSKWVNEDKAFHTVDDYRLKNIQELFYYLNNCDDNNFYYHHNDQKKDFANWVSDVLMFPALAANIRTAGSRTDVVRILKEFLTTNTEYSKDPEYERYMKERLLTSAVNGSADAKIDKTNVINNIPDVPLKDKNITDQNVTVGGPKNESLKNIVSHDTGAKLSNPSEKVEETINLERKFDLKKEDEPEQNTGLAFDSVGFRQFTDEELEKFIRFAKPEITVETDMKVEYLKTALQELKNMIKDLRRADKDPLVAELMLRTVSAKIDYYALSKNVDDYNHIIRLMKDVQYELEECAGHQSYNIAEEILKDLKLQGIAMKKA